MGKVTPSDALLGILISRRSSDSQPAVARADTVDKEQVGAAVSKQVASSGPHRWSLRGSHLAHWQPSLTASGSAASSCSGIPEAPVPVPPLGVFEMPADSEETRFVWKPEIPEGVRVAHSPAPR